MLMMSGLLSTPQTETAASSSTLGAPGLSALLREEAFSSAPLGSASNTDAAVFQLEKLAHCHMNLERKKETVYESSA